MTKLQHLIIQCFRLSIQKTNKTQPQVYLIWNLLQIYNAFALKIYYITDQYIYYYQVK